MPGCRPPCVEIFSGTNRQKWNYVKNLYMPIYQIDGNGDRVDTREITDASRIADEARYDAEFTEDEAHWQATKPSVAFERWLQWKNDRGTTAYGNLQQFKKLEHVGHCWMPCPYDTSSDPERSREMLGFLPVRVDHGIYYMKTAAVNSAWGFECTYDSCPYYIGEGIRYFYV